MSDAPQHRNGIARVDAFRTLTGPNGSAGSQRREYSGGRAVGGSADGEWRRYASILRRRSGLMRTVFLGVVAVGLAYTLLQTPVYRASALLEIRQGDGDVPSLAGLLGDGDPSEEYRRTHFELLQSQTLAGRVIADLRLDTLEEFNGAGEAAPQQIVAGFLERLVVAPVPDSRLVRVTFDAGTPDMSARVVNSIVSTFEELRAESRSVTVGRLAAQADSVQKRLVESEADLRAYTEANNLPYLVEEDVTAAIATRLRDLRGRLAEAEGSRYEREVMHAMVVDEERVELIEDAALIALEGQLIALRTQYARLSATFTDDYPATAEVLGEIAEVRALVSEERARIARRIEGDYRGALQREGLIIAAIDAQEQVAVQVGPQSGRHHLLRQAVLANRALYTSLYERQREAETAAAIRATDLVVIDPAVPPVDPHRPVFAMSMGLAMMLALVLGVGSGFLREAMDDTVQGADDLPIMRGVPVLGMIPEHDLRTTLGPKRLSSGMKLLPWSHSDAQSPAEGKGGWFRIDSLGGGKEQGAALADAFAALRTAVLFKEHGRGPRSVLVSSCRAGEGKTTVSVNLALSLSRLGHRVLLIDADLRRPAVHRALNIRAEPGLVDSLQVGTGWRSLIQTGVSDGLDVLSSGGSVTNAPDLLANGRMELLLRQAEVLYDFVIVDAPALFINASDATLLARQVDGVVVVVRSQTTPKALVDRIPDEVPNLMGLVLNDLNRSSLPEYYSNYFAESDFPTGRSAALEPETT